MKKIFFLLLISVLFLSCSSDSDDGIKSSANYIESFFYDGINPVQISIINELNTVHVLTNKNISVEPNIVVSKGATVKKEGDKYIVTAENGEARTYSLVISSGISKKNSFENWSYNDKDGYDYLSDLNWTSGNVGISTALQILGKGNSYPTKKTDGKEGKAVLLETIEGGTVFGRDMPILSGNFFLGNFNTTKMISDELAATEFGKLYFAKPKKVTGWYKYEASNDNCDIYAAFYQASDANGNEIILTAKDNLDERSLAYARVQDCSATGDDFLPFELNFDNYKSEPDFETYNYKLVITFASSKGGATFEGNIGSKLTVDEVEIEDY